MIDTAFWIPILIAAGTNVMLSLGLFITTSCGQLSIAHAALMGSGAYAGAVLTANFGWPFLPAICVGAVVGGLIGLFVAIITLPMSLIVQSLATLGFGETVSIVAYNIDYVGGPTGFSGMPAFTTMSWVIAGVIVAFVVALVFDRSLMGFTARGMRDSGPAAAASGVNLNKMRLITYTLGGLVAGMAGVISCHYTLIVNPADLGFDASFTAMIYLLFGGSYSIWGAMAGPAILTILPEAFRFATDLRFVLFGVAITVIVLIRPEGLIPRRATRVPVGDLSGGSGGPPGTRSQRWSGLRSARSRLRLSHE